MLLHSDIARIRLASQHLLEKRLTTPKALVAWMGAMQAQDLPMARWAIGARLPGFTESQVEAAIDRGELIRTHLLRPTWHFVTPEDIYWLLDLTAVQIKKAQSYRDRALGLSEEIYSKSNAIIEKSLGAGGHLTRDELVKELNKKEIATDQNRASHYFMRAELDRIVCSGASRKGKPTYALLEARVPKPVKLSRDESLAALARRYLTSRCPATVRDFTWWSGLPAADARLALELVETEFHPEEIADDTYWLPDDFSMPGNTEDVIHLLPTYDEFTLSYATRSASIPAELENYMKKISNRGMFWPIIVVNGQVVGIWKRTITKSRINLELQIFTQKELEDHKLMAEAAGRYASFIDKDAELKLSFVHG